MFKFLKEKISGWAKKVSESAKPEETEELPKEEKKKVKETIKKEKAKKKLKKKIEKIALGSAPSGEGKEKPIEDLEKQAEELKKKIKEKKKEKKEIKLPEKFNVGTQKVEPDLEKLEEVVEELEKPEKEEPKQGFFSKMVSKINKVKITDEDFEIYAEELQMLLLENNVAYEVAEKIIQDLKQRIVGQEFLKKEIEGQIKETIKDIIEEILIEPFKLEEKIKKSEKPYVVLFCGINGSGKTTSIAKIAELLKQKDITSVIAAADTFRAAAIDQIKKHGEKLGIKIISHDYGADPAAVGFDAIQYAKKNKIDCVLIDTAGRMHTSKNLMAEIEKINKVCKPDTKIFVGESITGNDAIEQVRSFNWSIGIDGIILSKSDIDEKGGTALSVGYVTKKPILYLGTGQQYKEIEPFDKEKFIERLGL